MARMLYIMLITIVIVTVSLIIGYHTGIRTATTSDGWIEGNKFVLEVDGQYYEWFVE